MMATASNCCNPRFDSVGERTFTKVHTHPSTMAHLCISVYKPIMPIALCPIAHVTTGLLHTAYYIGETYVKLLSAGRGVRDSDQKLSIAPKDTTDPITKSQIYCIMSSVLHACRTQVPYGCRPPKHDYVTTFIQYALSFILFIIFIVLYEWNRAINEFADN